MKNRIYDQLSPELLYLYNTGKCYNAYRTFGAQPVDGGVQFTIWAPDVKSVRVVGDFNDWGRNTRRSCFLESLGETGIFTAFLEGISEGERYKYEIEMQDGRRVLKADPFAFSAEVRPDTASIVRSLSYVWEDGSWMEKRKSLNILSEPLNIYEVHLGSWMRHMVEEGDGFYSYDDLTERLIPYVKDMGYTHIELMPLMEHPLDASWGYQVTGYYAATSRYGSPEMLMHFIDCCHREGIGVIMDWVPGHFCPDEHGLATFNGSMLYENQLHPEWGTCKFDFGRPQVRSFLLSNAFFWLEQYHIDGIRVDGVTSMLYLNFGIEDEALKRKNKDGGDVDLEAVSFLQEFNQLVGREFPGVFTAAEESSAYPLVTWPPEMDGLGFHLKWNMGWMHDILDFSSVEPVYRSYEHNRLTFSMTYAFSENYILPLSHDEVVHGKKSLLGRMPGDIPMQFKGLRLLAMYQMTHPGKKLNFMGHEIAPFIEWREYEELEWFMLGYDNHRSYQEYIRQLNHVYIEHPALWSCDHDWDGFEWIDPDNCSQNVLTYVRHEVSETEKERELLLIALNFNVQEFDVFRIGVPEKGFYEEIINSSEERFGGDGRVNVGSIEADEIPMHGQPYSIEIKMPVLGGCILKKVKG